MSKSDRPAHVQAFLEKVRAAFEQVRPDPETAACLERVLAALDRSGDPGRSEAARLPVCEFLEEALEPARQTGGALEELAREIVQLNPHLCWRRRSGASPMASPSFGDGHANAMIVGPGGVEERRDVWVGMSLLAPDVRYPDHRHSPEEIYLVLTGGEFRQAEGAWFEPGVGGTFYNEPGILHAMASGDKPLLAVWCLFEASAG